MIQRRHILWALLATAVALLLGGVAFVSTHWNHVVWYMDPMRKKAQPIPVPPMRVPQQEGEWYSCQIGSLRFDIPAALYQEDAPEIDERLLGGIFRFKSENLELLVRLPVDNTKVKQAIVASLPDPAIASRRSITMLYAKALAASGQDFRWSMSEDELAFHKWLIGYKQLIAISFFRDGYELHAVDDVEGMLFFGGEKSAFFEWRSPDGTVFGQLLFETRSGELDLDVVRSICASISFDGKVYPEELSADELRSLRDEMQVVKKGVTQ